MPAAGPVGLAVVAGLARRGTPCTVIEPRDQVSFGSGSPASPAARWRYQEGFGVAAPILAAR
ncbi:hypothetical protein GCM10011504_16710 [Siccirubricoccus deserti]|uniref:Uncharacterized protein n=1 Tax=Siccirubricoccus deserti TaxID=2013562 RepID=A0A9X0UD02_9PROT|nr:hypothetical protein [Siccirubricoccus deserti]MBC4015101.1 hypothetical protein [Siccirubricoccus deserti]GGC38919.1 hypothetical protein GCM10011504_16710 [Siccirubricoccus deserti]